MNAPSLDTETLSKTLQDMIAIPSLSGDEAAMAAYVEAFLKRLGLAPQRDAQDNVVAVIEPRTPGEANKNTLHLSGHTDTVVPVKGWTDDPYAPRATGTGEDRRIVGLGASDMKGGLAVMLHVAEALARRGRRPERLRVVCSFTVCEEAREKGKSNGVNSVLKQFSGRWAVTTEASCDDTGPTLALGCQGHARVYIALQGRSAHAARPEGGHNAVHAAAEIARRVEELHAAFPSVPVLGPVRARASAAVTTIRGGQAHNIIPEHCELRISRRLAPGETAVEAEREAKRLVEERPGITSSVRVQCDGPACISDPQGPLLKSAERASRKLLGQARHSWNRARTDLVLFKQAGMDILNVGPGLMGQAHVAGEYLHARELPRVAALLLGTCAGLDEFLASES